MTIVVVGLILVATAGIVLSFSGSGISDFFNTVGNEQESNIESYEIQQACSDLRDRINRKYCEQYMPAAWDGGDDPCSSCSPSGDWNLCSQSCYSDQNLDDYSEGAGYWASQTCASDASATSRSRVLPDEEKANQSGTAYINTGNQLGCDWQAGGFDPTVSIQGQTFNCISEGHIQANTCPAE